MNADKPNNTKAFWDDSELEAAHKYCTANEADIMESKQCGCFYCGKLFDPKETAVEYWINDRGGRTACCPFCGIDSVLPGNRVGLSNGFLVKMNEYWFGDGN